MSPLGRERGSRRELQVRITTDCADALYAKAKAERISLGQAAMAFVRLVHRELRAEAPRLEAAVDDGFAPMEQPTPRQLESGVPKQLVSLRITPAEADAMRQLCEDVRMSVPLIVDESIRRTAQRAGGLAPVTP